MLRELEGSGWSGLGDNWEGLLVALASPHCNVSRIFYSGMDWPDGHLTSEMLTRLGECLADRLRWLCLSDMKAGGALAADAFARLSRLLFLDLGMMDIHGRIPASIGCLKEAHTILLSRNRFEGTIPDDLGECTNLSILSLHTNQLCGDVPAALSRCAKLTYVRFDLNPGLAGGNVLAKFPPQGCFVQG